MNPLTHGPIGLLTMMHAGVGYAGEVAAEAAAWLAARQAMERAGLSRADCAFVFATTHYQPEFARLLRAVRSETGARHLIGCSGMGVLTTDGEFERGAGVAVLTLKSDGVAVQPFLVPTRSQEGISPGEAIADLIASHPSEHPLLMMFTDIFSIYPSQLIEDIEPDAQVLPIVGGAAGCRGVDRRTYQWCEDKVAVHGVAGVLWTGAFSTHIGVAQGCQPIGEPYVISKAEGNLIYEIAGRSAMRVLQESLETLPPEDIERVPYALHAGIAMDEEKYPLERGDFLVRNIAGIDPRSGAIAVAERVRPGQTIQFNLRDAHAASADMHSTMENVCNSLKGKPPAFGFYFNCLGRGTALYGKDNPHHDITVIKEFVGDIPLVGFFGNAEIAPVAGRNYAHNYTGVLALFAEGE
jgi:small ligand-binding sensory domain FIST